MRPYGGWADSVRHFDGRPVFEGALCGQDDVVLVEREHDVECVACRRIWLLAQLRPAS